MKPALVVLAAGIGSRYGGLKQIDPVGPGGATLMDYTIYDALKLGVEQVVMVVQRRTEAEVREHVDKGAGSKVEITYVHQDMNKVPPGFVVTPGRTKPWGTAQAVLSAAPHLKGPFIVANADDFYGRESLDSLDEFLEKPTDDGLAHWAMVGYRLGDTLPPEGMVSRALCVQDLDGYLVGLEEVLAIWREGPAAVWRDAAHKKHFQPLDSLVSMNLWGFTVELANHLEREFRAFLDENPEPKDEFYLPKAVFGALGTGNARVTVLPGRGRWCGMTSPEDREITAAVLEDLVSKGVYPENLWE
ncbi:MAG: sugar phosphate nucleotidyltransferase [Thermoanaerobaculales bacterium]|nr:sugar phosphate nucleotidyltransferase [Thermoanaerobaculales bacterium]